jgi:hypothetical protein
MAQIILTAEQMQIIRQALAPLSVCDPSGNVIGTLHPERCPAFIAELKRRAAAPGPRYTMAQVREHLQALEEAWEREGEFDEARLREILQAARARESK